VIIASLVLTLATIVHTQPGAAYTIGPWKLGMTREEVKSFLKFGPYTLVAATGGLETAHGTFQDQPANVCFGFDTQGLSYIQVWKYEGKEYASAKSAALDVFRLFRDEFGGAQMNGIHRGDGKPLDAGAVEAVLEKVLGTAHELGKKLASERKVWATFTLDMDPEKQPLDNKLHAQFIYSAQHDTFYIFVFQDRPSARARTAKGNVQLDKIEAAGAHQ